MCDYSLEMYQSRPARQGEEYVSNKFPSGSVGFVCRGDQSVAICMACDTELRLAHISPLVQEQAQVGETEVVTFVQLDGPLHRDAIRFRNGRVLSLQALGPGVSAYLCEPALENRQRLPFGVKAIA
jgi:hypothetical protein